MTELGQILRRQLIDDVRGRSAAARAPFDPAARARRCRTIAELRDLARRKVPRAVFDFVDGGANDEITLRRNLTDLAAVRLLPRAMVDVSEVGTAVSVVGRQVALPLLGGPTGLTGLVHHEGEMAIARAVHEAGSIYTLSVFGSYSIEEVAAGAPGPTWLGLYLFRDRGLVRDIVQRAGEAGFGALVLTVDVPRAGARERDARNGLTIPPRVTLRSLASGARRPRWAANFLARPRITAASAAPAAGAVRHAAYIDSQFDPASTWDDLVWLRELWSGPIVVKGLLRADDARHAVELGADAVVVSNHGGRQLDGACSSISALPAVADAVGDGAEVYLDGGIRRGGDIVKALATGARACLVARPLVYGLAAAGQAGVGHSLDILGNELRMALALAGCPDLGAVDGTLVAGHTPAVGPS
jgi:L-lactate dehydrogenase (cytochrome)